MGFSSGRMRGGVRGGVEKSLLPSTTAQLGIWIEAGSEYLSGNINCDLRTTGKSAGYSHKESIKKSKHILKKMII